MTIFKIITVIYTLIFTFGIFAPTFIALIAKKRGKTELQHKLCTIATYCFMGTIFSLFVLWAFAFCVIGIFILDGQFSFENL